MFNTVIELLNTIQKVAYFAINLSINTGKLIVNTTITSFDIMCKLLLMFRTILVILQEDLQVFLSDLFTKFNLILNEISNICEYFCELLLSLYNFTKFIISGTSNAITTFYNTILEIVAKIFTNFGVLIATIKQLIVIFGSGVWFVITIIPVFIVYVSMSIIYSFGRFFEEIKLFTSALILQMFTIFQNVIQFITDVPLESLAGLIIAFCLIYTITIFQITLYNIAIKFTRKLFNVLNHFIIRTKNTLFQYFDGTVGENSDSEMLNEENSQNFSHGNVTNGRKQKTKSLEEEENKCVICMERNKCILVMPCRHLCICGECSNIMKSYQRTCPICRGYVGYTIHVY